MNWPFNSASTSANGKNRDSGGWDRYQLLPTSESASTSNSNNQDTSPSSYNKEWPSDSDSYFNSNHKREDLEQEEEEFDSLLPISNHSSSSSTKNRIYSFISFISICYSRLKRYPWYIKFLIFGIFDLLCFHFILGLFHHSSSSTDSNDLFKNPTQALQLLHSLTSIYSSSSSSSTSTSNDDPTRFIFKDHSPGLSSTRIVPIKHYESISDQCLDSWISKGQWNTNSPQSCSNHLINEIQSVHAVVNGSDLVQISARHLYRPDGPLKMDSSHRYGDHNELLYSMRSFRDSLKKGNEIWNRKNGKLDDHHKKDQVGFGLKKMNILASAYPLDYQIEFIQESLDRSLSSDGGAVGLADEGVDLEEVEKDEDSLNKLLENQRIHREPTPLDLLGSRRRSSSPEGNSNTKSSLSFGVGSLGKDRTLSGQVPRWLEKTAVEGKGVEIEVHYDSEYFAPLPNSPNQKPNDREVEKWRERVIPTFNSLAVESQIYNLPTTSTSPDSIVYLNDDFFTLLPSSVSDYNTPLYGTVIKSLPRITSMYWPSENPIWRLWNPAGEEVGIKRAAWVLGQRFPSRAYPYITHHPRSLSLPLLREAAQTFPQAFGDTALSRFRAQQDVPVSIQAVFLGSWYIVQRHREALLWSWVVAKWGGLDGKIDQKKRDAMWNELTKFSDGTQDSVNPKSSFKVLKPNRSSISESSRESLVNAGLQPSLNTEYDFSSQDGYALSYLDHLWFWQRMNKNGLPDLSTSSSRSHLCTIKKDSLGSLGEVEVASELFKRISFENQEIGDCFIPALISASGMKGLEAFLPREESRIPNESEFEQVEEELRVRNQRDGDLWELEVEHLPITGDWKTTDFSLNSVVQPKIQSSSSEIFQNPNPKSSTKSSSPTESKNSRRFKRSRSLRMWTIRLIHRYSYVLGTAESELYQMKWTDKVEKRLKDLDTNQGEFSKVEYWLDQDDHQSNKDVKPLTYLALNDDLKEDDKTEKLNSIVGKWFEGRWSAKDSKMPDERPSIEL